MTDYDDLRTIVQQYVLKTWLEDEVFSMESPPTEQEWQWIQKTIVFDDSVRCTAQKLCADDDFLHPPSHNFVKDLADLAIDPVAALQTEIYRVPRWVEESN